MPQAARPLSPHLGIYRWQWTMTLSILHRASGIALAAGTLLLVAWLLALAAGPAAYAALRELCATKLGMVLLFGWTWSLAYHLCNGIRHLAWDVGWGFAPARGRQTGWAAVAASLLLTGLVFAWALADGGAA
jgi:succinate dehydrogenase / fumarate reductase cytochrome b subunit